jgi:hypothetical protein
MGRNIVMLTLTSQFEWTRAKIKFFVLASFLLTILSIFVHWKYVISTYFEREALISNRRRRSF